MVRFDSASPATFSNYINVSRVSSFFIFLFVIFYFYYLAYNMAALENVWSSFHDVEYVV